MKAVEVEGDYAAASKVIHNNRCHWLGIIVNPDGSNNSYVDVYDGTSTNDDVKARVRVVSTTTLPVMFPEPVLMQKGIYVSFETNLSSVTVLWKPIRD